MTTTPPPSAATSLIRSCARARSASSATAGAACSNGITYPPQFPSQRVKDAVAQGHPGFGDLGELRDVTYLDLPTSHWPMWSRPQELATMISDIARGASTD